MKNKILKISVYALYLSLLTNIIFLLLWLLNGDYQNFLDEELIAGSGLDGNNFTLLSLPVLLVSSLVTFFAKDKTKLSKYASIASLILLMIYGAMMVNFLLVELPQGLEGWRNS